MTSVEVTAAVLATSIQATFRDPRQCELLRIASSLHSTLSSYVVTRGFSHLHRFAFT